MSALGGLRVVIAGAGAVGSALAVRLTRAGARVTLADPAALGDNASGVAAGMLAPAFETLLDGAAGGLDLLRRARDLWPPFAESVGLPIDRAGAMAVGSAAELDRWEAGLRALGVAAARLSPAESRRRSPWLAPGPGAVWTSDDWRLDPAAALAALAAAGPGRVKARVTGFEGGRATLDGGEALEADALVIATGWRRSLIAAAPELTHLTPIKGHILRAPTLGLTGPVVRLAGGYICPSPGGALIGSTMEAGREDTAIDPAAVAHLRALAARALPAILETPVVAATGVRASAPDGLPLAGYGSTPGVWLAVGARRNGWLLAPLIAEVVARGMMGKDSGEDGRRFDPGRFVREAAPTLRHPPPPPLRGPPPPRRGAGEE